MRRSMRALITAALAKVHLQTKESARSAVYLTERDRGGLCVNAFGCDAARATRPCAAFRSREGSSAAFPRFRAAARVVPFLPTRLPRGPLPTPIERRDC